MIELLSNHEATMKQSQIENCSLRDQIKNVKSSLNGKLKVIRVLNKFFFTIKFSFFFKESANIVETATQKGGKMAKQIKHLQKKNDGNHFF